MLGLHDVWTAWEAPLWVGVHRLGGTLLESSQAGHLWWLSALSITARWVAQVQGFAESR